MNKPAEKINGNVHEKDQNTISSSSKTTTYIPTHHYTVSNPNLDTPLPKVLYKNK